MFARSLAWLIVVVASVASLLAVGSQARADSSDDARARAHFLAGSAYFEDGRFEEAAREFQEAFDLSGRPEMLLNVSRSHDKAGHLAQAIADLELLLARYPKSSMRPNAEEELVELRARKKKAEEEAAASASQASAESKPPLPAQGAVEAHSPAPEASTSADSRSLRVGLPTWIAAGSAVALAAVAGVTGVIAHGQYGDLEKSCLPEACTSGDRNKAEKAKTLAIVSTATTFTAVGVAAAAVAMFFFEVGVPREDRAVAFLPMIGGRQLGAAARLNF